MEIKKKRNEKTEFCIGFKYSLNFIFNVLNLRSINICLSDFKEKNVKQV